MSQQLFISDLHLSRERPETLQLFLDFLQQRPTPGDRLFIMGDLFDVWVGDDEDGALADDVRTALSATEGVEEILVTGLGDGATELAGD